MNTKMEEEHSKRGHVSRNGTIPPCNVDEMVSLPCTRIDAQK